jgi:hypothetical protein
MKSHFATLPLTFKDVQEPTGTADETPTLAKASGKKRKALDLEAVAVNGDPRPGVLLCRPTPLPSVTVLCPSVLCVG